MPMPTGIACVAAVVGTLIGLLALPVASYATEHEEPPAAFEPVLEAENFSITEQRQAIYDTPEYQAELAAQGRKPPRSALEQAADPEASSQTTSAMRGKTAAPATSACTTGKRTATASCARCCSPRAAARRSPVALGNPAAERQASRES